MHHIHQFRPRRDRARDRSAVLRQPGNNPKQNWSGCKGFITGKPFPLRA